MENNKENQILKLADKVRQKENARMENMTEEEILKDLQKTNIEAFEYAKRHNIKTIKITSENETK